MVIRGWTKENHPTPDGEWWHYREMHVPDIILELILPSDPGWVAYHKGRKTR